MKYLFEIDGEYDEEVMLWALARAFPKERFIKVMPVEARITVPNFVLAKILRSKLSRLEKVAELDIG